MGLFDKMFGNGVAAVQAKPDTQQQFNTLKQRFAPVLAEVEQQKVQLRNLHVQDNKLYLKGVAPSEAAKNAVWDKIKSLDAAGHSITADISVNAALAGPPPAPAADAKTYTVKSGDTLSKIAKQSYGDANEYMRIFYANPKLKDPDKIQVGQVLNIPPDTDA
jgi:nucleoid-associated protein YgaU